MRAVWRALCILATFLGVGYATMHFVIQRAVAHGTPEYEVRLAGAMAGLFAGGISAVLVGLGFVFLQKKPDVSTDEEP